MEADYEAPAEGEADDEDEWKSATSDHEKIPVVRRDPNKNIGGGENAPKSM